jgi:hypothetical protein
MSVLGWPTTAMESRYTHVITPIHNDLASRLDGLVCSSKDASSGTNWDPHLRPQPKTLGPTLRRASVWPTQAGGGGGI